ncbi:PREDICTED: aurora kinase A and ninein-interacting protein [Chrysochloris asiatica]|uniref:Aurora kinase A and ninein-interacting protein n=1 Tax=Chrysochloris asiatica TaxID=185453 RepID=A0A9B0WPE5_CHRAS|nr:PREDICTED: aurora kinase A and ninein-interacting protein [Chrysochloris asiatica]
MRRRGPEEEACGVWLDAAELKRRKVQTHLTKPGTKMLTLFPGERKTKISFTQRSAPPAGIRQTSITSFFTLQSGKTSGDNQTSVSSRRESQISKESKKSSTQLEHFLQGFWEDCVTSPLATSTPADIQGAGLFPYSLQETSGHHGIESPFLPDTPICAGESKTSLAFSFTQDLESSCLLDQKEGKRKSSGNRKWLHGSKKKSYQDVERCMKPSGDKCHLPLDKTKFERKVSAKENGQSRLLQTYRDSWSGKNTVSVKQSPCPSVVFSWDSERRDKDSLSQLFTEDSQGQRVIAHNWRVPFRDVTNDWNLSLGRSPLSPQAQYQGRPAQLSLQPELLFTQDSEVHAVVACWQDCCRFLTERQKQLQ